MFWNVSKDETTFNQIKQELGHFEKNILEL